MRWDLIFSKTGGFVFFTGLIFTALGCSVDVMPVHESRIRSAHLAERPLERGPDAPGAFRYHLKFEKPEGYAFDPGRLEFTEGVIRLKKDPESPDHFVRLRSTLETSSGIRFTALDHFNEITGPNHKGEIRYQLSIDTAQWVYFNGKKWVPAGPSSQQANTADELNTGIPKFHVDIGMGSLYLRAFFVSPTHRQPVELKELIVSGVNTQRDGWD